MLRFSASLLPLGLLMLVGETHAQLPGPFSPPFATPFSVHPDDLTNVDALRDQILRQAGIVPSVGPVGATEPQVDCVQQTINPLGFAVIPLPNYLRSPQLGLPFESGVLVTAVHPSSPAYQAGVRPGMTLVEIDGTSVDAMDDLRQLAGTHVLRLLTEEGLQAIEICQPIAEELAQPWPAFPRSLSVSEANGILAVAAIVDTEQGPQQVELHGTRKQVELQLQQLCPEVQAALRPQLR